VTLSDSKKLRRAVLSGRFFRFGGRRRGCNKIARPLVSGCPPIRSGIRSLAPEGSADQRGYPINEHWREPERSQSREGPTVRIHLPLAASPVRTALLLYYEENAELGFLVLLAGYAWYM
jgi:hypothetical protein